MPDVTDWSGDPVGCMFFWVLIVAFILNMLYGIACIIAEKKERSKNYTKDLQHEVWSDTGFRRVEEENLRK